MGFIGVGYGAKMALWAAAARLRVSVPPSAHNGIVTYREHVKSGEWFQVEFVVPVLMQVADMHHILSLIAPRPFLLSTADGSRRAPTLPKSTTRRCQSTKSRRFKPRCAVPL